MDNEHANNVCQINSRVTQEIVLLADWQKPYFPPANYHGSALSDQKSWKSFTWTELQFLAKQNFSVCKSNGNDEEEFSMTIDKSRPNVGGKILNGPYFLRSHKF